MGAQAMIYEGLGGLGKALSAGMEKDAENAKKAKVLRGVLSAYAPEMKDRAEAWGLGELEQAVQKHATQQVLAQQNLEQQREYLQLLAGARKLNEDAEQKTANRAFGAAGLAGGAAPDLAGAFMRSLAQTGRAPDVGGMGGLAKFAPETTFFNQNQAFKGNPVEGVQGLTQIPTGPNTSQLFFNGSPIVSEANGVPVIQGRPGSTPVPLQNPNAISPEAALKDKRTLEKELADEQRRLALFGGMKGADAELMAGTMKATMENIARLKAQLGQAGGATPGKVGRFKVEVVP